jgi:hypothetical protein
VFLPGTHENGSDIRRLVNCKAEIKYQNAWQGIQGTLTTDLSRKFN